MSEAINIEAVRIVLDDATDASAQIAEALAQHVADRFGPRNEKALSLTAHDAAGHVVGGINGASHWRWLYIRNLWIAEGWRRHGLGRRLMLEAEHVARERTCVGLYLDTFDADAERFYIDCGFGQFGHVENFPPGHSRRFLRKTLA